jgi:NAD(P)-dependent dehydrogenase (short-subunit alcohol dehydrogenase family)
MPSQQTILVTGATSGIGRETALHLARLGHRVLATGRKQDLLAQLVGEAEGLALESFALDVNDPASMDRAVEEVDRRTQGQGLDVLVNNAGYGNMAPMELVSDQDLRAQFETNVFGLVGLTQRFLPGMRRRGAGKIINISSVVGKLSLPLQGVYCATKHAVEALSDAMRMELAPFGIWVSMVEPGSIRSQFGKTISSTVAHYQQLDSPYRAVVEAYPRVLAKVEAKAPGPACIAKTVARIVRKRRPAARYVSPRINRVLLWLVSKLPTRWVDGIMKRVMGLTPEQLLPPADRGQGG